MQSLGLSFADADECSPLMLLLLQDEWVEDQRRRDWRAYVSSPRKGRPGQMFPLLKQAKKKKRQSVRQMLAAFTAATGGKNG